MICRSKKTLPKQIKFLLFKALVMSHLEYCVAIWGGAVPSVTKKLFSNQKKALRVATRAKYNSHTDPLFAATNTLKFQDLYKYNMAKIGSSIIHNTAPKRIKDCFTIVEPHESLRNRECTLLLIPNCQTDTLRRLTDYSVPKCYNDLPYYYKNQGDFFLRENIKRGHLWEYENFTCKQLNCYSCSVTRTRIQAFNDLSLIQAPCLVTKE
jgi:hypothetical protein